MARKIKRFFVFLFFSLFFSLLSGRIERSSKNEENRKSFNSAEAKCCPEAQSAAVCKNRSSGENDVCCATACDENGYCP